MNRFEIYGLPCRHGKVRDIYDLGDGRLLLVATDRISAFDWILPTEIPDKGRVLNKLSEFWFTRLGVPHHMISTNVGDMPLPAGTNREALDGRTMLVHKTEVVPIECVVRGYLAGSGWKEYQKSGTVCSLPLPAGLKEGSALPQPIFTPATKEESGHDENISFEKMCRTVGEDLSVRLRSLSLSIYKDAGDHAQKRGIIIADTKVEYGLLPDRSVLLIDEVLTPDSSRFWPRDSHRPGGPQVSWDKQFVRDWLEQSGWDKNSPPPPLPDHIVTQTREKYVEAYESLTHTQFPWR